MSTVGTLMLDGTLAVLEKSNKIAGGSSSVKDHQHHLFLFEDVLVICKEMAAKKQNTVSGGQGNQFAYRFKHLVPVNMMILREHKSLSTSQGK